MKALEEYTMRKAAALDILALKNPMTALSVKELKALMHYKKRKDYGAVPSAKKDLLKRFDAIFFFADQTLETYLSIYGSQ